jgi:excinuclease ABC subunit A
MKQGFQRVKIDGEFYEIADAPTLDKKFKHDIDVVVDRIVVREDIATRLADSFETALKLADGLAMAELPTLKMASHERRAHCLFRALRLPGLRLHDPGDRAAAVFVQQPQGACPTCDGLGTSWSSKRR